VVLIRERTIPTKWQQLDGEVSANFSDRGCRVVSITDPHGHILSILDTLTLINKNPSPLRPVNTVQALYSSVYAWKARKFGWNITQLHSIDNSELGSTCLHLLLKDMTITSRASHKLPVRLSVEARRLERPPTELFYLTDLKGIFTVSN
jgi:hypothetical protein